MEFNKINLTVLLQMMALILNPRFSVECRVGARFTSTRYDRVVNPHTSIPRPLGIVSARIKRAHWHSTPLRITSRFLRLYDGVFSYWLSFGRILNHFSATSGVVSSR